MSSDLVSLGWNPHVGDLAPYQLKTGLGIESTVTLPDLQFPRHPSASHDTSGAQSDSSLFLHINFGPLFNGELAYICQLSACK